MINNEGIYVRTMPGKPHSKNPKQQKPYVNHRINGKSLDKHGNIVSNKSAEAHVPLEEFIYREPGKKIIMINDAGKKQALDCFIENIACMSDKEYQERVWVRAEGPECDNIDDTICHFFDEDYVLEKYKDFGITEIQYKSLMKLDNFIDEHGVEQSGLANPLKRFKKVLGATKSKLPFIKRKSRTLQNLFLTGMSYIQKDNML